MDITQNLNLATPRTQGGLFSAKLTQHTHEIKLQSGRYLHCLPFHCCDLGAFAPAPSWKISPGYFIFLITYMWQSHYYLSFISPYLLCAPVEWATASWNSLAAQHCCSPGGCGALRARRNTPELLTLSLLCSGFEHLALCSDHIANYPEERESAPLSPKLQTVKKGRGEGSRITVNKCWYFCLTFHLNLSSLPLKVSPCSYFAFEIKQLTQIWFCDKNQGEWVEMSPDLEPYKCNYFCHNAFLTIITGN